VSFGSRTVQVEIKDLILGRGSFGVVYFGKGNDDVYYAIKLFKASDKIDE
jgi:hypothetical protein